MIGVVEVVAEGVGVAVALQVVAAALIHEAVVVALIFGVEEAAPVEASVVVGNREGKLFACNLLSESLI